jgi:hypothetical protein
MVVTGSGNVAHLVMVTTLTGENVANLKIDVVWAKHPPSDADVQDFADCFEREVRGRVVENRFDEVQP